MAHGEEFTGSPRVAASGQVSISHMLGLSCFLSPSDNMKAWQRISRRRLCFLLEKQEEMPCLRKYLVLEQHPGGVGGSRAGAPGGTKRASKLHSAQAAGATVPIRACEGKGEQESTHKVRMTGQPGHLSVTLNSPVSTYWPCG